MKPHYLILLLMLSTTAACAHESHENLAQTEQISVVGVGEIEAEPDQATLRIDVKALAKDLATAKRQADQRYKNVLSVLKDANIPDKQIKVVQLSMQPRYEWSENKQQYKGEEVTRSLTITINDLDKVADVMQSLVENGLSTMNGLSTGFQDRSILLQQALAAAANDARAKAKFLAEQFDRNLGVATQISESNNAPIQQPQDVRMLKSRSMEADSAPREMFGTQTISARVNVSFKLR